MGLPLATCVKRVVPSGISPFPCVARIATHKLVLPDVQNLHFRHSKGRDELACQSCQSRGNGTKEADVRRGTNQRCASEQGKTPLNMKLTGSVEWNDGLADLDVSDTLANRLDDPGTLRAKNRREDPLRVGP